MELSKSVFMNKSALVIGGGGFLGKTLVQSLKANGYNKIGIADITNPHISGVDMHEVNLLETDVDRLSQIFEPYDIIISCLGQITKPINLCLRLNTEGLEIIAQAVKVTKKFLVHFSTVTVYGSCDYADEKTNLNPETPYSCAKACAEFLINSILPNEKYCILRLSNLYGGDQPKGVFSYLKRSYKSDRRLEFNNDGEMIRYYLHINDCADISTQLIKTNKTGIYNLIGPDRYSLKELISLAEKFLDIKFQTSFDPIVAWDNTLTISDEKLKNSIEVTYNNSLETSFNFFNPVEQ